MLNYFPRVELRSRLLPRDSPRLSSAASSQSKLLKSRAASHSTATTTTSTSNKSRCDLFIFASSCCWFLNPDACPALPSPQRRAHPSGAACRVSGRGAVRAQQRELQRSSNDQSRLGTLQKQTADVRASCFHFIYSPLARNSTLTGRATLALITSSATSELVKIKPFRRIITEKRMSGFESGASLCSN